MIQPTIRPRDEVLALNSPEWWWLTPYHVELSPQLSDNSTFLYHRSVTHHSPILPGSTFSNCTYICLLNNYFDCTLKPSIKRITLTCVHGTKICSLQMDKLGFTLASRNEGCIKAQANLQKERFNLIYPRDVIMYYYCYSQECKWTKRPPNLVSPVLHAMQNDKN